MTEIHRLGRDPWRDAFNMSAWESVEALWDYTFSGDHLEAVKLSTKWFDPATARDVMWWVPAGYRPSIEEGLAKLYLVEWLGPTPDGFTFRQRFAAPSAVRGGTAAGEPAAEPGQGTGAPDADRADVAGER